MKENLRGQWALAWCMVMCAAVGGRARADEAPASLLLLEDPAAPQPRLLAALRIQLSDMLRVDVRTTPRTGALPAQLAEANRLAHDEDRVAVVWVEAANDSEAQSRQALLYVVGRRQGRALVEVVRVPGERGPDLERVLALKLRELLADMRSAPVHVLADTPPQRTAATAVSPPMAAEPERSIVESSLALGPRLSTVLGASLTRAGVGALGGVAWATRSLRAGLGLGLDWYPSTRRMRSGASLDIDELAPRVRGELTLRQPLLDVSVSTGVALDSVSIAGRTALATTGRSDPPTLAWLVGAGLTRELGARLTLAAFGELAVQARRQVFAINGEDALDLGRLRLTLGLELRLRLSP